MNLLVPGLLIGAAFGAILVLSGLSNPRLIVGMLRLSDFRLLKLLVTALATGIAGIALLDAAGLAHLGVKGTHVIANLVGGAIFGVGFAVAAYCPGTALAGAVEGRRDALFAVLGGLLGTAVFTAAYGFVKPALIEPLSLGALLGWLVYRWRRAERLPLREQPAERRAEFLHQG
jgi:uncharacterized membrane protein YedE/YeeE